MSVYRTYTRIKNQIKMFTEGFKILMKPEWINMFSVPELQQLISGESSDVDLEDLKLVFMNIEKYKIFCLNIRSNVVYQGGYHRTHPVIKWLWQTLEQDFSREERALFLRVCLNFFFE
jgi:ubiquitin-protein ligase E3 B